eukprot:scaffold84546_cov20-Prasinocladus_malaysianus.AAC.1
MITAPCRDRSTTTTTEHQARRPSRPVTGYRSPSTTDAACAPAYLLYIWMLLPASSQIHTTTTVSRQPWGTRRPIISSLHLTQL